MYNRQDYFFSLPGVAAAAVQKCRPAIEFCMNRIGNGFEFFRDDQNHFALVEDGQNILFSIMKARQSITDGARCCGVGQ